MFEKDCYLEEFLFTLTNPYRNIEVPWPKSNPLKHSGHYTTVRTEPKVGRNDLCHCGSNKKYKNCCLQ